MTSGTKKGKDDKTEDEYVIVDQKEKRESPGQAGTVKTVENISPANPQTDNVGGDGAQPVTKKRDIRMRRVPVQGVCDGYKPAGGNIIPMTDHSAFRLGMTIRITNPSNPSQILTTKVTEFGSLKKSISPILLSPSFNNPEST